MKFDHIIETILGSGLEGWQGLERGGDHTWFYKDNVNLRIETSYGGSDIQAESFEEDWANKHADPKARGYFYNVYYAATLIRQVVLVSVDGARAHIPLPDVVTKKVKPFDYKIAEICQDPETLADYLGRSGLSIA